MNQYSYNPDCGNRKLFETINKEPKSLKDNLYDSFHYKYNDCLTNIFKNFDENKNIQGDNHTVDKVEKEKSINDCLNSSNIEKIFNINNYFEQKNEKECEINKYFGILNSNEIDENSYNSILDFSNNINNFNINEINIKINSLDINNNKKENSKNDSYYFLGKKREQYKLLNENDFKIFHKKQNDKYPGYLIDKVLNKKIRNLFEITNKYKKREREIDSRRGNSDNIRKKIKTRFFGTLRKTINERLKSAGSKQFFDFLPHIFISNISKAENKSIVNLTLNELFSKNFYVGREVRESDIKKYNKNLSTIKYLEKNKDISIKSNFEIFKNMKFYQIFNEYLNSKEFEMDVSFLKEKKENEKYIIRYISKAAYLMEFFIKD